MESSILSGSTINLTKEFFITVFETNANRIAQQKAAQKLEAAWNVSCVNFPTLSAIDFVLHDPDTKEAKGLVEFKDRNVLKEAYPTFFISENKLKYGLNLAELLQIPFILAVQWKDEFGWIKLKSLDGLQIFKGGRKDRGALHDLEDMVHIPTQYFKTI